MMMPAIGGRATLERRLARAWIALVRAETRGANDAALGRCADRYFATLADYVAAGGASPAAVTVTTCAPASVCSSAGATGNTAFGVPAAAQTTS